MNEFARVRRLEIDAAVAVLIALRRTLIFGVRLAELLLRCRLRDRRGDCRRAECKRGAGERHTARDALVIVAAIIHDRLPSRFCFAQVDAGGHGGIRLTMTILFAAYRCPYSVKT